MTKPTNMGTVVRLALERARRAQEGLEQPDGAYEAGQAELLRAERLGRAKPRLRAEDLDDLRHGRLKDSRHLTVVRAWVERSSKPILCIAGAQGTGKSFAAGWALAELGGAYLQANDLVRLARGSWRDRELLEDKLRARLLVLDDLGTEDELDSMHGPLLDLVDRRQGRPWLTLITVNLLAPALRERYPEPRLWSRLDACWVYVASTGPDLRAERSR